MADLPENPILPVQGTGDALRKSDRGFGSDLAVLAKALEDAEAARREAEEANRAKSAFLANMSHELRTPLNAIIGYSEMLAEEAADSRNTAAASDLEKIRQSALHLLALVNDLLDLSKIEAGKVDLRFESIDLEPFLDEVQTTLLPRAKKNSNRFEMIVPVSPGLVHCDPDRLRQILFNLLDNAFKFTSNGKVELRVERFPGPGGDRVRFAVADTGIGIDSVHLERIFEAFTQADTSSTRRYGGTGMGLAISQRFSRMLGGDIRVSSEPGRGSTFTLELPCRAPGT